MRHSLDSVCRLLTSGEIVALPTETVYGLAASLKFPETISQIFTLKGRPSDNPLIVHAATFEQVGQFCEEIPPEMRLLGETFWPGPLTMVLSAKLNRVPPNVTAGLSTVALRVPNHPLTLQVLDHVGPVVMPSANLSGRPSATRAEHVEMDFGESFPLLDGGACNLGMESTVLFYRYGHWEIARMGAISAEELAQVLGYEPKMHSSQVGQIPVSPGQKYRHYAPQASLLLDQAIPPEKIGVIVGFSDRQYPPECRLFSLGPTSNVGIVSKNLYHTLRLLDQEQITQAWVDMDFPKAGLWLTVAERLIKASQ